MYFSFPCDKTAGAMHTKTVGGVDAGREPSRRGLLLPGSHPPTVPQGGAKSNRWALLGGGRSEERGDGQKEEGCNRYKLRKCLNSKVEKK